MPVPGGRQKRMRGVARRTASWHSHEQPAQALCTPSFPTSTYDRSKLEGPGSASAPAGCRLAKRWSAAIPWGVAPPATLSDRYGQTWQQARRHTKVPGNVLPPFPASPESARASCSRTCQARVADGCWRPRAVHADCLQPWALLVGLHGGCVRFPRSKTHCTLRSPAMDRRTIGCWPRRRASNISS